MRRILILAMYRLARALGLFALARRLTRERLRILCYHGFAVDDEAQFRPSLFMTREAFAQRMDYLRSRGFPVLPLGDAVERLRAGTLPADAVAITIDDGFASTRSIAAPVLAERGFPSLLYLTSYYFAKGTPVFRLSVDYICWKSAKERIDLDSLGVPKLSGEVTLGPEWRRAISRMVHEYGSTIDEPARVELARKLGELLEVDYAALCEERILSLVSAGELRELQAMGMEIGLHTHRHIFPAETGAARRELAENRRAVEPVLGRPMRHFCYPSGDWNAAHFGALEAEGVATATTCESGLAVADSHPLALPRILDDSRVSAIEFEAEMSGFAELLRIVRRYPRPDLGKLPPYRAPEPAQPELASSAA